MEDFLRWLTTRGSLHPVAFAGEAHYRLVTIHPFVDGNGRTARLLMNLLLLMRGYPPQSSAPAIGSPISELSNARNSAAQGLISTLLPQRPRSDHWTSTSLPPEENPRKPEADAATLMKISALAKAVGVTVPTIRFWTAENLLEVAEVTASAYQLYAPEMIARCELIRKLKAQRLTLAEIKSRLPQGRKRTGHRGFRWGVRRTASLSAYTTDSRDELSGPFSRPVD